MTGVVVLALLTAAVAWVASALHAISRACRHIGRTEPRSNHVT